MRWREEGALQNVRKKNVDYCKKGDILLKIIKNDDNNDCNCTTPPLNSTRTRWAKRNPERRSLQPFGWWKMLSYIPGTPGMPVVLHEIAALRPCHSPWSVSRFCRLDSRMEYTESNLVRKEGRVGQEGSGGRIFPLSQILTISEVRSPFPSCVLDSDICIQWYMTQN